MKIAILVAGLPPEVLGGAETQAAHAAALLAERHEVSVYTRSLATPEILRGRPRCSVIRRSAVRLPGLRFCSDILLTLARLGRRRAAIDALVAYQTVIDGLIAVLAGRLWSIPVLVWVRSEGEFCLRANTQSRLLSPWVFRHADRIAVQSPSIRLQLLDELRRADQAALAAAIESKIRVIANGVELPMEAVAGGIEVLYVGRLATDKGVIHLVEAMRRCPQAALTIVGEGPERPRLETAAQGMTNVRFVGSCHPDAIPALMARAGILVLPSLRNEGLPNVVLEAMATGVAVIASRNAGIPDVIRDRETGILVEPGDVDGLARGITALTTDDALRVRIRAQALLEVRRYAWPNVIATLERELATLGRER